MTQNVKKVFVPKPDLPPPASSVGVIGWMRENLFSSWINSLFTLAALAVLLWMLPPILSWGLFNANWIGEDRTVCDANPAGACWVFVERRFLQIMFGLYYGGHPGEVWRPALTFAILIGLASMLFVPRFRYKLPLALFIILVFPFFAFGMIHGEWFGFPVAKTSQWGGFMLTFILASVGITAALPIGIILALGRRSNMPVIRAICVVFIEFWRGVPLITVLFMASNMLPLFFPADMDFDKVARALIGITLFQSAYTAEAIRGGLQAIPSGQFEAADALGMRYWKKTGLIILPQALKISIPGIVNTFIALFKDTSLVAIIGLLDLLNMSQAASRSFEWKGYDLEAYIFAASIFFICCFSMSRYSQSLERKLDTGHKR